MPVTPILNMNTDQVMDLMILGGGGLSQVRGEFALWGEHKGKVFAIRDPLGVIPLYYLVTPRGLRFSTHLRSLVQGAETELTLNKKFLQGVAWRYFGARGETPFNEIRRLPAGHWLEVSGSQVTVASYVNWEI